MGEVIPAARAGLPVLVICNGFQILCEAHLLPVPDKPPVRPGSRREAPAPRGRPGLCSQNHA